MEKTEKRSVLLRALTGFFIGIAAIAPGVSGGAITVIFGLYEPIADAIAHIWQDFRKKLLFLLPLGVGGVMGMLVFGKLISFLFQNYHDLICALFVGLIAGTLPSVFKTAAKQGFRLRYLLATLVCGAVVVWLTAIPSFRYTGSADSLPYWLAVVCGGAVGIGTVVPGISASFVLMAMGMYEPMLRALDNFDIPRLLLMGVGFGGAVLLLTRLVSWLFKKAYGWISFATAGMLVGSVFNVIPVPTLSWHGAVMVLLAIGGAALSYFLLRLKKE